MKELRVVEDVEQRLLTMERAMEIVGHDDAYDLTNVHIFGEGSARIDARWSLRHGNAVNPDKLVWGFVTGLLI